MKTEATVQQAKGATVQRRRAPSASNGLKRRRFIDKLAERLIFMFAIIAISIIFLIFIYVGRETLPLFTGARGVSVISAFVPPFVWQPVGVPKYNILPLVFGTIKVTLIAMLIATPLALA